jgi:steroid delta-isomerase-like uncharacterized protein
MANTDQMVAVVNEHMRLENAHDFPGCIAQFGRPRYEVMADGDVFDGPDRVDDFLSENRRAFPDFHFDPTRVSPTSDAVIVEGRFRGTHQGSWRGLPATGRSVDFAMCLIFEFEGEVMTNERLYFDLITPLVQLGVADDPNSAKFKIVTVLTHPITIGRAALRSAWRRLTFRKH